MSACCCMGPQRGQPVCPCRMKNVVVRNGRYVEEIDLGPAGSRTYTFNLEVDPLSPQEIAGIVNEALSGYKPTT